MKVIVLSVICCFTTVIVFSQTTLHENKETPDSINNHKVILDDKSKIISWINPQSKAYDQFLHQRWNFIKTHVPNCPGTQSAYPQYYFYCAYWNEKGKLKPDTWMNDVGEKIPNWVESALLYYAYTGDTAVMNIVTGLATYAIEHGTSPATFAWPNFPYTTTNAGDTEFRGFTTAKRFALYEVQVDHAGDMGLAYYRLYLYSGDERFKTAALNVANTLADKVRTGSAIQSPWPYRVILNTGEVTAEYGANWMGCYMLLDNLVRSNLGNVATYRDACKKVREFILAYPMQTGYWTDGHTDNNVNSNTYKSNMSASNVTLYMLDHPEFNPNWKTDVPALIKWTEDNFVFRCAPGEPATQWGANIVGEQDGFLPKMDYQTARYAAECARWFRVSGDEAYKEKAYRSLNWVTYCNDTNGLATESAVSKNISNWWSDCYGEGPRMFYHALAAIPEWAPAGEDHILYSECVLKNVSYHANKLMYTATMKAGIEYIKLSFKPAKITLGESELPFLSKEENKQGYTLNILEDGGYVIGVNRVNAGEIIITGF